MKRLLVLLILLAACGSSSSSKTASGPVGPVGCDKPTLAAYNTLRVAVRDELAGKPDPAGTQSSIATMQRSATASAGTHGSNVAGALTGWLDAAAALPAAIAAKNAQPLTDFSKADDKLLSTCHWHTPK